MFIPVQNTAHQRTGMGQVGGENTSFKKDSGTSRPSSSSEVVEISSNNERKRVSDRLANFPPIPTIRLSQISAEIESGTYEVDLKALADAVLLTEFNIAPQNPSA